MSRHYFLDYERKFENKEFICNNLDFIERCIDRASNHFEAYFCSNYIQLFDVIQPLYDLGFV